MPRIRLTALILPTLLAAGSSAVLGQDRSDERAKQPAAASAASADRAVSGQDVFGLTRMHKFHLEFSADEWEAMQAVVGRGPFGGGGPGRGQPPGGPGANRQPPGQGDNRREGPTDNRPPAQPDARREARDEARDGARDAAQPEARADEQGAKRPAELHKSAGFGTEFPWAHGKLEAFGKTFADVGVRYKGNGSYMGSSGSLKRNLKIDLDRYEDDAQFEGLKAFNLNAGGVDPTRLREALGFEVFRAAGVPASRTAFVELTLTVPGKYDHELVGMYTLIEQVDKVFLKDHFGDSKGLLMKPERLRGFAYLGNDWNQYESQYQPKQRPSNKQAKRVIEFVRLLDKGSDEEFQEKIADYLDVDEFLRFLATSAWLSNMDSLFAIGHNFYIYLDARSNKLNFMPWDLDLSFAGFPMMGSPDDLLNLSLKHPHSGTNKLIDRLLAVPEIGKKYDTLLAELTAGSFAKDRLLGEIAELETATTEARAREQAAVEARKERPRTGPFGGGGPGGRGRSPSLTAFVEKRIELVAAQIAGENSGYTPRGGFGPGGRGRFGPGNFMARPLLEWLDANKDSKLSKEELVAGTTKFFAESDSEHAGKLDQEGITAALERVMPGPPGFGPPGGGPPPADGPGDRARPERAIDDRGPGDRGERGPDERGPGERAPNEAPPAGQGDRRPQGNRPFGGPGGFSFATPLAAALLKRSDSDHDDHISLDEAVAAAEALFAEADSDKKGELDETKLATAISALFPQPPGFGPPGGGPPGNGPPRFGGQGFGGQGFGGQGRGPGSGRDGARPQSPPADEAKESRSEERQP
jgi:spore coat protein CotH